MANNYVQFSEFWDFGTEEAADLFLSLARTCQMIADGEWTGEEEDLLEGEVPDPGQAAFLALPEDFRDRLAESATDFGMFDYEQQKQKSVVWIYSDESGNLELAAEIAQAVLTVMGDNATVLTATCAATCSKPRVGEFGGSWIAVSSKKVRGGNTWDDAEEAAKEMSK